MEGSVATAPRDLLAIKARSLRWSAVRAARRLHVGGAIETPVREIGVPSTLTDRTDLADLLNRLGWYLPPGAADDVSVRIPGAPSSTESSPPGEDVPEAQRPWGHDHLDVDLSTSGDGRPLRHCDELLVWDWHRTPPRRLLRHLGKTRIVDPSFYSTVASTSWPDVTNDVLVGSEPSYGDVDRLLDRPSCEESYVFATGPSLDRILEHDVPHEACSIVCNSIVRDSALLEHLDPDVLVFADPVFHFGPSRYAARFRDDVVETLERFDCLCVVPAEYRALLVAHYPAIEEHVVGLPVEPTDEVRVPRTGDPRVAATSNIMTLLMLPIAMAVSERITVVGADGRDEGESYFWQHSNRAQYDDDMMETVVDTHPSFFRDRRYTDYYQRHVATLARYLRTAEGRGIDVRSLTPSHVPCLDERLADEPLTS